MLKFGFSDLINYKGLSEPMPKQKKDFVDQCYFIVKFALFQ